MKKHLKKHMLFACVIALVSLLLLAVAGCSAPEQPADVPTAPTADVPDTQTPDPDETPAALPAAYAAIVAQYADAMNNNFYADAGDEAYASFGEDVALEWQIARQPAYYALHDVDGNGTQELIIASLDEGFTTFYDIFSIENDQAVRLFDYAFGNRTTFEVYANGTIQITWSDSAFSSGYDFYLVEGAQAKRITALAVMSEIGAEDEEDIHYLQDDAEITEDAFSDVLAQYESAEKQSFAWVSVLE